VCGVRVLCDIESLHLPSSRSGATEKARRRQCRRVDSDADALVLQLLVTSGEPLGTRQAVWVCRVRHQTYCVLQLTWRNGRRQAKRNSLLYGGMDIYVCM